MIKRYAIKRKADMVCGEPYLNDASFSYLSAIYKNDSSVAEMMEVDSRIFICGREAFISNLDPAAIVDLEDDWHRGSKVPDDVIVTVYAGMQRLECVRGDGRPPYLAIPYNGIFVDVAMADVQAAWSRELKRRLAEPKDAKSTTIFVQIDHEDFI